LLCGVKIRLGGREIYLTRIEQKENIGEDHYCKPLRCRPIAAFKPHRDCVMSLTSTSSAFDNSHYEKACDQAIAMCDGNLRSTIKALIMANEYLEVELLELQAAISSGCAPLPSSRGESSAA
jgi:hypothetical protein